MSEKKDSFAQSNINDEKDLKELFRFIALNLCGGETEDVRDAAGFENKKIELKDVIDLCSSYGIELKVRVEFDAADKRYRSERKKTEPVNPDDPF